MGFAWIFDFLLRHYRRAIQTFAAVMAIDSFVLVFVTALRANQFRRGCGHAAQSFFDLGEEAGVDPLAAFESVVVPDFSPLALAVEGASFFAAS